MDNWNEVWEEGLDYAKTIKRLDPNNTKLDNHTIYNMVCMACESMLTAIIGMYGEMAEHSTVSGMLRVLGTKTEVPDNLIAQSRFLNRFNTYCSLDSIPAKEITKEDIIKMKDFILSVGPFLIDIHVQKSGKYSEKPVV